jgi:hypothetical protein
LQAREGQRLGEEALVLRLRRRDGCCRGARCARGVRTNCLEELDDARGRDAARRLDELLPLGWREDGVAQHLLEL